MPRKDPQEHREKSAGAMRRLRTVRKTEKLAGATAGAGKKPSKPAKSGQAPSKRGRPPAFKLESDADWSKQLIMLGRDWIARSKSMLATHPSAAYNLAKAGIELVNANRPLLPRPETDKGPQPGSVAALESEFLDDPEYLRLAEAMLARKCELQLEREREKQKT